MRHRVGLHPAGMIHRPRLVVNGDQRAQQAPGLGAAHRTPRRLDARRLQQPIQRRRAGREHLAPQPHWQPSFAPLEIRQPEHQRRGQPLAAELVARQPQRLDHAQHIVAIDTPRPGPGPPAGQRQLRPQQFDRVLAAVAELFAHRIEHPAAALPPPPLITFPPLGQQFPTHHPAHFHPLLPGVFLPCVNEAFSHESCPTPRCHFI